MLVPTTMRESISPEYELLLSAMRRDGAAPAGELQWVRAVRLAQWHRLGPVLFDHLNRTGGEAPEEVMESLKERYLANATRNLFIDASLDRMLHALAAAGVPAMLLKGLALLEGVYPDPALREMGDMDLLVPASGLDEANAALAALGYGRMREITRDQDTTEWMRAHHRHDPPLMDPQRHVKVELHWHIVKGEPRTHFDVDDLWRRAQPASYGPPHVVPSPEDLLLHACIHFTYNRMGSSFGALAQVCDIARILDLQPIDAEAFIATARAYRLENPIFIALFSTNELGFAVPQEMLAGLRPRNFDERLGRRLVELRVLRTHSELPRRSLRKAVAPGRWGLERSWGGSGGRLSLARAYGRRALRGFGYLRKVLKEPRTVLSDYRLNRKLTSLTGRMRDPH